MSTLYYFLESNRFVDIYYLKYLHLLFIYLHIALVRSQGYPACFSWHKISRCGLSLRPAVSYATLSLVTKEVAKVVTKLWLHIPLPTYSTNPVLARQKLAGVTLAHCITAASLLYSVPQMGEVLRIISQHLSALKIKTTIKLCLAYQWYQLCTSWRLITKIVCGSCSIWTWTQCSVIIPKKIAHIKVHLTTYWYKTQQV